MRNLFRSLSAVALFLFLAAAACPQSHFVALSWPAWSQAPGTDPAANIQVFRQVGTTGTPALLTTIPGTAATSYSDNTATAAGTNYCYFLVVVNADASEVSAPSNTACASPLSGTISPITGLTATGH